jgi:hypothetical protein
VQRHVGVAGDDGGGVVPKVMDAGSLEVQCRASIAPGVRQILPAQREATRTGEDGSLCLDSQLRVATGMAGA